MYSTTKCTCTLYPTGEEFVPSYMITSGGNLMEILVGDLDPSEVNASVIATQKMAMTLITNVIHLALKTQVVEEQPITYDTG